MSQALYRKWRPQSWQQVAGQQHVIETLRNALSAGRIAHAYLFSGPRGTGKTTTARLLAKAVNCLDPELSKRPCGVCDFCRAVNEGRFLDLIEIDAASNTSVDDVRDLRDKINYAPNQGRYKVYIIDEVHMLSTAAFNALLKTLEEPPSHAIFILATTEIHKIPATVLSRCQRHDFRRIAVAEIVQYLKVIVESEKIQVEEDVLSVIARQSTGAMRDAISLLDQLASTGEQITLKKAQEVLGVAANQAVIDVVQSIVDGQTDVGLGFIHAALDQGSEARQFARQIVDYLRGILLVQTGLANQVEATREVREKMAQHARDFSLAEVLGIIHVFNYAATEARSTWQPALPLEMAFLQAIQRSPSPEKADKSPVVPEVLPKGQPEKTRGADLSSPVAPTNEEIVQPPVSHVEIKPQEQKASKLPEADQEANQTLGDSWASILTIVRQQNSKAYGLLNSCKGRFMSGEVITLVYASAILKDTMEKKENLEIVERVFSKVFQRQIVVKCKVDNVRRDAVPPGVDDDGMVASALRDLGGEIVDMQ